jgi:hypothetical protein
MSRDMCERCPELRHCRARRTQPSNLAADSAFSARDEVDLLSMKCHGQMIFTVGLIPVARRVNRKDLSVPVVLAVLLP